MSLNSKIEWTDATWNPITGCSVVSPGCTHCYAMRLAGTRMVHHTSRAGLTTMTKAGPVWNGEVRLNEQWLTQPLHWRRPRMIFVCAHGDLFHESVPDEWIDRVFAIMALCPQHTFQVLTKRSARMRDYCSRLDDESVSETARRFGKALNELPYTPLRDVEIPLPNVWLGVSCERQCEANERIPDLLVTPAAIRFVSAEPLLGPVDLTRIEGDPSWQPSIKNALTGERRARQGNGSVGSGFGPRLDWVIVGGESGPSARQMNSDWARSLRDQCAAAGVAFFMKQMTRKAPIPPELLVREFPR